MLAEVRAVEQWGLIDVVGGIVLVTLFVLCAGYLMVRVTHRR